MKYSENTAVNTSHRIRFKKLYEHYKNYCPFFRAPTSIEKKTVQREIRTYSFNFDY